jgi:flagellar L-ring protein precursor FlgH
MRKYLLMGMTAVLLSGCVSVAKKPPAAVQIKKTPPLAVMETSTKREEGSLWSEVDAVSLFPDRRARKVGDIVKIRIVEDPEANLNANTSTGRTSGVNANLKFLGYMQALGEKNSRLPAYPDDLIASSLGMNFDGSGTSDRDGHIKAYVPAIIVKKFSNGNMFVSGKREIRVNNETEYITIAGIIRGEDIDQYNEISSSYVANAQISYSGRGPIADKQKPGWLTRILSYAWPF